MVFFPEYTDHGPQHIEDVMMTAESLITDNSWSHLTPEDSAALALSIVLHDCAMHLSEDGFLELLDPTITRQTIPLFAEKAWPELWVDFLGEASRFDAKKLRALFGDSEPVRTPPLSASQMTLRDRLLIGEFLRRHHSRLAHEIALWGVPGPRNEKIALTRVPEGLADLSGLIARSHGLDLWGVVEKIPRIYRREHYKVHVPFLMTVVRVADYLQIHSERAPKQVLNVRALRSPVSQGEWSAHEAVQEINSTHDDPEALVVIAKPKDVKTFLKIQRLLTGLQYELDESWAVLGEVYGRVDGLRELGLTIRRVKSNLDDKEEFSKSVPYFPDKIAFESDPEILKLLVEPLYGNDGGIAVRELVQNAVDACLERQDYIQRLDQHIKGSLERTPNRITVHLDMSGDVPWLTVTDTGIGMTVNVIKNYFLRAGASFRRSDAWKRQHETPEGKPRVLRSGRFGIGVLAAFLLGDQVEVTTRHVSEPSDSGIHFSASVDDEAIELHKVVCDSIGTTIRIRLDQETASRFRLTNEWRWDSRWDWDWFRLKEPRVELLITPKASSSINLESKYSIPQCGSKLFPEWHRIIHPDFDDIQWSFVANTRRNIYEKDNLFCNGIRIRGEYHYGNKKLAWLFSLQSPVLSIFDSAGKLPLNLARSQLTRELSFEQELLEDIYRDLISFLLVHAPTQPIQNNITAGTYNITNYPGTHDKHWFWCTPSGVSLCRQWLLQYISPPHLYLVPKLANFPFQIAPTDAYVATFGQDDQSVKYHDEWVRFALTGTATSRLSQNWLQGLRAIGRRILIDDRYLQRIRNFKAIPKTFLTDIVHEWSGHGWSVLSTQNCPQATTSFQTFAKQVKPDEFTTLAQWYFDPKTFSLDYEDEYENSFEGYGEVSRKRSVLQSVWQDAIGESAIIPFSRRERKKFLACAYTRLASYIRAHEVLAKARNDKKK